MPQGAVSDGKHIDTYIPPHLKDMFYRHPTRPYAWNNGLDPYGFSTDGLVLYLPLWALKDNSFKSVDAYGHLFTRIGALWQPDGYLFDGTNDQVTATSPLFSGTQGSSQMTIVYWIKTLSNTGYGNTITVRDAGGANWQLFRASGELHLLIYDGATSQDTGYDFVAGRWVMVSVVIDGIANEWLVSVNQELFYTWVGKNFGSDDGGNLLNIGRDNAGNFGTGTFGEIAIYNRAWSVSDRNDFHNKTKWRYQ